MRAVNCEQKKSISCRKCLDSGSRTGHFRDRPRRNDGLSTRDLCSGSLTQDTSFLFKRLWGDIPRGAGLTLG